MFTPRMLKFENVRMIPSKLTVRFHSADGDREHSPPTMTANRWELVRTSQGWKIKRRTLRPLDGSDGARQILRQAIAK